MQDSRSARTVCSIFCILLVLSFSQAYGENLFRWTDDTGRVCYSNVSPPAGVKAYSVDMVFYPAVDQSSSTKAPADTGTKEKKSIRIDSRYPDFSSAFLEQRIIDRKKSIGHIEALLRKHPNDSALRKRLFNKKQYLFEDLTRLKNFRP